MPPTKKIDTGIWRPLLLAGAVVLALAILLAGRGGEEEKARSAAEGAAVQALGLVDDEPGLAAQLALASERLEPSEVAETAMLAVATHSAGIERVIDPGTAAVTAAVLGEQIAVTADANRMLQVWRASDGALLGQVETPVVLTILANTYLGDWAVGVSAGGIAVMINLSNPHTPLLQPLGRILPEGEHPAALSFAADEADVLAAGEHGTVVRLDFNTGRTVSRWSVPTVSRLNAAAFEVEPFGAREELLAAVATGAVVAVNLQTRRVEPLITAGGVPGEATSIAREPYGKLLLVGATEGMVSLEAPGAVPVVLRGQPVTGVAFDELGASWTANTEGLEPRWEDEAHITEARVGGPVRELVEGAGGALAITRSGEVDLLGPPDAGMVLGEVRTTPVVAFESNGRLLTAEGLDANHIEKLVALDPGHTIEAGEAVFNPEVRDYLPDPDWWEPSEEGGGLYVSDVVADSRFVVAGGQDPTGTPVVLVWDGNTTRALQRLTLDTGDFESEEPSVVSDLVLLPGKHMIAAYSVVQQTVAVWSTDTWEQIAVVPVGPAGELSLSPDESTLTVARLAEDEEEGDPANAPSRLIFVDTGSWRVDREVKTPDTLSAVWAPDGSEIATVGEDGMLRFWSADGSVEARRPIQMEGTPLALAWRPDGRTIAVSLEEGGIVIVTPENGGSSALLPGSELSASLVWSPDGSLLAATTSSPAEGEGEYFIPGPAQLWTLGASRLARRMCQLAGGPMSQLQWNRFISSSLPRRRLCVAPRAVPPDQIPEEHGRPILAYQSDNGVFIADGQGRSIQVGSVDRDAYPPLTFAWSAQGLAWFGAGQVGVVADKSDRASLWPCHCSGVGWLGSSVFALEDDGEELLRFAPGDRWPERVPVTGPLGQEPSVLGTLGKTLVVAGYLGEPSRGTPNMLSLLGADGEVTRVPGKVHGVITGPTATAPDGKQVAFVSSRSGGACYFSTKVGILDFGPEGRPRVRFPAMPGHAWLKVVASLQISANGILSGTFWDMDCQRNESPPRPAPGERFELQGSRWVPTGERGGDIQRAGGLVALVTPEPEFNAGGRLTLGPAGEGTLLAESVTQIMMRP